MGFHVWGTGSKFTAVEPDTINVGYYLKLENTFLVLLAYQGRKFELQCIIMLGLRSKTPSCHHLTGL